MGRDAVLLQLEYDEALMNWRDGGMAKWSSTTPGRPSSEPDSYQHIRMNNCPELMSRMRSDLEVFNAELKDWGRAATLKSTASTEAELSMTWTFQPIPHPNFSTPRTLYSHLHPIQHYTTKTHLERYSTRTSIDLTMSRHLRGVGLSELPRS